MKFQIEIEIPDNESLVKSTFSLHIENMPIINLENLESIKKKIWDEFIDVSKLYGSDKLGDMLREKGSLC